MNIYEAITGIMAEGYAITKGKKSQQQGFMYRGIDDVMNTFQPLLAKHRVFVIPEVLEQKREDRVTGNGRPLIYSVLRMKYTFCAEDGTSVYAIVVGEGMDSGDKASNKAMSIAMKYAMFQVFCIPTEEMDDPDRESPPESMPPKNEKLDELVDTVNRAGLSSPRVICDACGGVVKPYTGRNGDTVDVETHIGITKDRYGAVLCRECAVKRQNEKAAAARSVRPDEAAV